MTLQGPSDLLRNQDDAAGRTAPVHEPVPVHCLLDKVGRASAQQYEARKSKEQLPQQPAQSKTEPRRIPRLRAVVESQAFKNILVDEMDMMLSRAATLIQANWRGYRLRQKLISQMLAAKAIQEAWRRFNTRRLLRSSKVTVKRVSREEGDIPYHPPQQVRFQPPEDKPPQVQPVMMSKETQFPSSDSLVTCIPQLGLLQHPAAQGMAGPGVQAPHGPGAHGVAFLPHQTMAMRLPSPGSLDPKCQPCLLTKTVRSSCLIRHLEGDAVKTKHVTTRVGPPAHLAPPSPKTPSQVYPPSRLTKTPSLAHLVTCLTKAQSQVHLSSGTVKIQSQAQLPVGLTKTQSQAQLVSQTKSFYTARQSTDLNSKTQSQPLLTGPRASVPSCQHLGAMSFLSRPKSEDRPAQLQPQGHVQSKTTHGPCPVASEAQGMLVPLMTSTGHPTCNIEPWGDSGTARAQPPVASQAVPCQEAAGPVDAGLASGVPSVNMWETARGPVPWDTLGSVAAVSPRQPGELTVSVQTMEKILVRAAVVIQAFARGYLVRSTIRVWHQCATVIQASWRGFCVRRNLARLYRATTIIQAAWRGYCTRRDCAQQMLLPAVWLELGSKVRAAPDPRCFPGSEARLGSDHRCFQSCQPHICSLCQSLSPGLGNPPSVVMLVGSSPRTCHMCGHTLPTRVVHGMGRSISSQGGLLWACSSPKASQGLCRSPGQNRAAMAIQSAWRGFKTRRQLRQQQSAAKMVQSNWRGHYTRSCLTTDMLLGSGAPRDCSRDPSRHSTHSTRSARWPGV
uniref:IQ motif containing N n=1 Tax=Urocitellus parryii TaxID=9999 RepID=A0A8D2KLY1_UROPR